MSKTWKCFRSIIFKEAREFCIINFTLVLWFRFHLRGLHVILYVFQCCRCIILDEVLRGFSKDKQHLYTFFAVVRSLSCWINIGLDFVLWQECENYVFRKEEKRIKAFHSQSRSWWNQRYYCKLLAYLLCCRINNLERKELCK